MSEQSFKARVAALLKRIEWSGSVIDCCPYPSCGGLNAAVDGFGCEFQHRGHAPDCALAALLKECE